MQVLSYTEHNPPRAAVKPLGVFHTPPNIPFNIYLVTDNRDYFRLYDVYIF